jgi:hypothetical protein
LVDAALDRLARTSAVSQPEPVADGCLRDRAVEPGVALNGARSVPGAIAFTTPALRDGLTVPASAGI